MIFALWLQCSANWMKQDGKCPRCTRQQFIQKIRNLNYPNEQFLWMKLCRLCVWWAYMPHDQRKGLRALGIITNIVIVIFVKTTSWSIAKWTLMQMLSLGWRRLCKLLGCSVAISSSQYTRMDTVYHYIWKSIENGVISVYSVIQQHRW